MHMIQAQDHVATNIELGTICIQIILMVVPMHLLVEFQEVLKKIQQITTMMPLMAFYTRYDLLVVRQQKNFASPQQVVFTSNNAELIERVNIVSK